MAMNKMNDLIEKLNLQPHPEGGYYRRNWQSAFSADVKDASGKITHPKRALGSSIIYYLPASERCAWHRLACEEMWHHYSGSPLKIHMLSMQKGWESFVLGSDVLKGELPQIVIPPRTWFCAEVIEADSYSFCAAASGQPLPMQILNWRKKTAWKTNFPSIKNASSLGLKTSNPPKRTKHGKKDICIGHQRSDP